MQLRCWFKATLYQQDLISTNCIFACHSIHSEEQTTEKVSDGKGYLNLEPPKRKTVLLV